MKAKTKLHLKLIIIAIPSFIAGFLSSPMVDNPVWEIPSVISGALGAPFLLILFYFLIIWIFPDAFEDFEI